MSALWHVSTLRRTRTDIQTTSNDEAYSSKLRQIRVSFVGLHTVMMGGQTSPWTPRYVTELGGYLADAGPVPAQFWHGHKDK